MNAPDTESRAPRSEPRWLAALRRMLMLWVRIRRDPPSITDGMFDPGKSVCYVLERYGLSNALILEQACRDAGLPSALAPMPGDLMGKGRAFFAVSRREGWLFRRARSLTHSEGLAELVSTLEARPELDVQLVPVSIFIGRAPDRQSGWFSVLFSENWPFMGRFRRALAVALNGRNTLVQFAAPISLRQSVNEGLERARTVRKVSRVLRTHFRRQRAAVIGPDLSHRRELLANILGAPRVREAIAQQASRDGSGVEAAEAKARAFGWEIAADYSDPVVRSLSFLLKPVWNRLFDGIVVNHVETIKQAAPGHAVVYTPSHRSHMDYLLLSYLLYQRGLVPPHIGAGVNLNLPLIGPVLRRGGAFFLRRTFKSNALYSAVFSEYIAQLFARGVAMEYFIEGGRSRTGRLLQAKAGMLSMTVRSFLRERRRNAVFQPVFFGYERLAEGGSYIGELSGQTKKKESLFRTVTGVFGVLRSRYGKVTVNFGEPIYLEQFLDEVSPEWREFAATDDSRPAWLQRAVDTLGTRILVEVNRAADVSPIALLAMCVLSTPKHAIAEDDLLTQLALCKDLLAAAPYSSRVTVTALSPPEIIAYGEKLLALSRNKHALGDVLLMDERAGILQSYFRNNVQHLFAVASWVACCFLDSRKLPRSAVVRLGKLVYPYVKAELFLPWDEETFGERVQQTIDFFLAHGLLESDTDGRVLRRPSGGSDRAFQLRVFAHSLLQAFERYYICIALLVRNGSGQLSGGELENLCHLTAQRVSLLYAASAPEFFDKSLFRNFIGELRENGVIRLGANAKLEFDERLHAINKDARIVLSREIRHSILQVTPEARAALAAPESE
jgi:glycerol-3-phosphate O-acyltransferase